MMIETICHIEPIERAHRQLNHLVWQLTIWITVNDRDLVSLGV